jgi:hypothetical protein
MEKELFYIRKEGYLGNAMLWWHKSRNGYTCDINEALKVDKKEAERICQRPEDTAYSCQYIDTNEQAKIAEMCYSNHE